MTAVNILTHYNLIGPLPFDRQDAAHEVAVPAPLAGPTGSSRGAERIVIQWWDLNVQRREVSGDSSEFWRTHTLDQLAAAQNVPRVSNLAGIRGIWPQEDLNDGFDLVLRQWRNQSAERPR